ncbi:hypothetical protein IWX84_000693 [Flavobacterium sp. CG_9.10]|nr:hypothetical protein [Flavobacterium sp. CG_9.10]
MCIYTTKCTKVHFLMELAIVDLFFNQIEHYVALFGFGIEFSVYFQYRC